MNGALKLLFLHFIPILALAQGPINGFMPQKGQWDIATTYSQEKYDDFFDTDGKLESRSIRQQSYNLYLEHGFNQQTSVVITAPYISHNDDNKGFQDASLWLKYRNDRTAKKQGISNFITAFGVSFPLSQYPTDNPTAIGRGAATIHGRLLWQYDANYGWFIQIQSGLDFQFSPNAVAAIPLLIKGGIGTKWLYADLWFEHFQSLNTTSIDGIQMAGRSSIWDKIGTTIYVPITPWIGVFTGGAIVLSGKNIGQGKRLNAGLVFRLGG